VKNFVTLRLRGSVCYDFPPKPEEPKKIPTQARQDFFILLVHLTCFLSFLEQFSHPKQKRGGHEQEKAMHPGKPESRCG
jgi:hypothetical protein